MKRKLLLVALLYAILVGNSVIMVHASSETKITFKLLAIEGLDSTSKNIPYKDGQNLIMSLLRYDNWNNSTKIYRSQMKLLSFDPELGVCKRFYTGQPTKENIEKEVSDLVSSDGYTISFLYISSHACEDILTLDTNNNTIRATWLNSWLGNYTVIVTIDTCGAEWFVDLLSNQTVLASCEKYQDSYGNPGIFSMSLIDSFSMSNDTEDGWLSVGKAFEFAKNATEEYATQNNFTQNPIMHSVLTYDPPWILRTQVTRKPDINGDGAINILDISIVAKAFGSKPGDPRWDVRADIDCSKIVDFDDLLAVLQFGKKT